jgi:hypothetical protein
MLSPHLIAHPRFDPMWAYITVSEFPLQAPGNLSVQSCPFALLVILVLRVSVLGFFFIGFVAP